MLARKNRFMMGLTLISLLLSMLVHVLHRGLHVVSHHGMSNEDMVTLSGYWSNTALAMPALLWLAAWWIYRHKAADERLPLLNALTLTAVSYSMVAGGGGGAEFHFSIFMVIALIA